MTSINKRRMHIYTHLFIVALCITTQQILIETSNLKVNSINTSTKTSNKSNLLSNEKEKTKVIIIGAGAAGLAASTELQAKNIPHVILEARNRVGGRVYSAEPFGYPIDVGAILITMQKDNPILTYAKQFDISLKKFDFGNAKIFINGIDNSKFTTTDIFKVMNKYYEKFLNYLVENFEKLKETSIEKIISIYFVETHPKLMERITIRHLSTSFHANTTRDLKYFKSDIFSGDIGFGEETMMTSMGYANILKPLAKGKDIRMETVVSSVTQVRNATQNDNSSQNPSTNPPEIKEFSHVVVETLNGKVFIADYCIVTVPLGILKAKKIKFSPAVSAPKQSSIDALAMFDMNKIFVEFSEKFWDDTDTIINLDSDENRVYNLVVNLNKINNKNLLLFMIAGDIALDYLISKSAEEIKGEIVDLLRGNYPGKNVKITNFYMSNWRNEEFTLGSFSEFSADENYRRSFLDMEGRIVFAGEHTHLKYNSFVYGAWKTGERAAKQVIEKIENE